MADADITEVDRGRVMWLRGVLLFTALFALFDSFVRFFLPERMNRGWGTWAPIHRFYAGFEGLLNFG
ncbi:MAG: hypothetical protein ACE5LG_01720 [Anaerolineae bacterium]